MSHLTTAIELTEAIDQAISEGDVEKIAQLDKHRQKFIDQYYSDEKFIDAKLTLKLKQMNDLIVIRLNELQSNIRSQQAGISQASKVSKAYRENSPKQYFIPL